MHDGRGNCILFEVKRSNVVKKPLNSESKHSQSTRERKVELEAALEAEDRMSRRQVLLKKLWKLNQQRPESPPKEALAEQKG
jgi:hypothetical protein